MEYFVYCRDRPGSSELRDRTVEAHWSFMDAYADAMIARGPTMDEAREVATGSVHIVDLPDAEAVRVFAFEEPNYLAGVYREVMLRRWQNLLGGATMWDFPAAPPDAGRFLIIGHGAATSVSKALRVEQQRYLVDHGYDDRFIARGPLLSDDGSEWLGGASLVELPDRAAVERMLADAPLTRAGLYAEIEIHDWQPGGRPVGAS
jgi:uncharacterized protein YciI